MVQQLLSILSHLNLMKQCLMLWQSAEQKLRQQLEKKFAIVSAEYLKDLTTEVKDRLVKEVTDEIFEKGRRERTIPQKK